MFDYFAIVDAGNGMTNAILKKASNKSYRSLHFPSVRARATGDTLGLGEQFELAIPYVDWNGYRYVWGDSVTTVTQRRLERHMGIDRYGNEFHQFLVAVALADLGLKDGDVSLTLFAPPGIYNAAKENIKAGFLEDDGQVNIRLKGDKQPRHWRYHEVKIFPEGLGAIACFTFDDRGKLMDTDILDGSVVLADLGLYTTDIVVTVNGVFNPETLDKATYQDAGVNTHLREPILRELHSVNEDFTTLTIDHVDHLLRQGLESGDFTVTVAGKSADVEAAYNNHRRRFAEWLANNIFESDYNGFRGSKVMLVGGGSLFVRDHLQEWYGDKIIDTASHPNTKNIHPAYFNAVGGMRLALAQAKQKTS